MNVPLTMEAARIFARTPTGHLNAAAIQAISCPSMDFLVMVRLTKCSDIYQLSIHFTD